jgi:uncharacterized protein
MKKITHLVLLGFVFVLSDNVIADFDLGNEYYNQKNYEKAFKEFEQAAKNGDHDAQFNLGVMYLRGESVPENKPLSYAWIKLASQAKNYAEKRVHEKIYLKFDNIEKTKADGVYNSIFNEFSDDAISKSLEPDLLPVSSKKIYRVTRIKNAEYPKGALHAGLSSFVDVIFSIDKDGTTRDHIVFASSNESFKKPVLESIRGSLFEPTIVDGKPVVTNGIRYRFTFKIAGSDAFNKRALRKRIAKLKNAADTGDAFAQFNYAYFLEAVPTLAKDLEIDNPNEWYSNAAQNGNSAASYFLGRNLINGDMCKVDSSKGTTWLLKASQNNLSDAQYLLAIESFSGALIHKDYEKGFYWLKRASNNSDIAKLRMAWLLTTISDDSYRDIELASTYFSQVPENHSDRQTYLRTAASLAAGKGNFKSAIEWQEKALEDAKKLELPTNIIVAQLASYQNNKPWREEP